MDVCTDGETGEFRENIFTWQKRHVSNNFGNFRPARVKYLPARIFV